MVGGPAWAKKIWRSGHAPLTPPLPPTVTEVTVHNKKTFPRQIPSISSKRELVFAHFKRDDINPSKLPTGKR